MQWNNINKKQGITLISLIITIIILVILATITVNIAIDGNLFGKAKGAKQTTNDRIQEQQSILGQLKNESDKLHVTEETGGTDTIPPLASIKIINVASDSITISVSASDYESGLATSGTYAYYLNSESTARNTGTSNTYTYTGLSPETQYTVKVIVKDQAGNEKEVIQITQTDEMKINAVVVAQEPTVYYGKEVENYGVKYDDTAEATNKWRIFYADENNIYLIADDYIHADYAPDAGSYEIYVNSTSYRLSMNNVYQNYTGAASIESTFANKWLSAYYPSNKTNTNTNIKAVAYMLDTKIWNPIYKNEYAEYAIGGPTLEMYCASYKDTHPSKYIECTANSTGYQVRWNGGSYANSISGVPRDEYNSIYIKYDTSKARAMWLASPSASATSYLMYAYYARLCGRLPLQQQLSGVLPPSLSKI